MRYSLAMDVTHEQNYEAFFDRDKTYDGILFVGVKTTGIFCRPTCPAKRPKPENCEFFKTAQGAMLAGYRACKRCHPHALPDAASDTIKHLIRAVEENPEKRWKASDFKALGIDESTVRRQFKKRFNMTFVAYARARRMGLALKQIREGETVTNAQIDQGYESSSGFRDAFTRIMGAPPSGKTHIVLSAAWIDTPLGAMIAMADDKALYLLEFSDRRGLEREVERMRKKLKCAILPGNNKILQQTEKEICEYFSGARKEFSIPLAAYGTDFQRAVWNVLCDIPYGQTRSYADQAIAINNPKAVRAVARANGSNQCAIIIPCHRVIGSDGSLTGYAGGLPRKEWLLEMEKKNAP